MGQSKDLESLLRKRLDHLQEEYKVASEQLAYVLDDVSRLRIQRRIESLEHEIQGVELELENLERRLTKIIVGYDMCSLPEKARDHILSELRDFLRIAPERSIEFYQAQEGKTAMNLWLNCETVDFLHNCLRNADKNLVYLKFNEVHLQRMSGDIEIWRFNRREYELEDQIYANEHQRTDDNIKKAKDMTSFKDTLLNLMQIKTDDSRKQRNRDMMLDRVRKFWIEGVLKKSLYGVAAIEVGLQQESDYIIKPWDAVMQMPGFLEFPLPDNSKLIDVFNQVGGEFLILGGPGSGKTTILLELTENLINQAKSDSELPIPVVFNLSSWQDENMTLGQWLIEKLNSEYYIPSRISLNWLENSDLILLLDGLDEVKAESRESCVNAINEFRKEFGLIKVVVCCRVKIYEALKNKLKLNSAVVLQPLDQQKVDQYLKSAGDKLAGVREAMQYDAPLRELARTPLMLYVMSIAYKGKTAEDLGNFELIKDRRKHLFETYVECMFHRLGRATPEQYVKTEANHWLSWLAYMMRQYSLASFRIEQIQPYFLKNAIQRRLHNIITQIIAGLGGGIFNGAIIFLIFLLAFKDEFSLIFYFLLAFSAFVLTSLVISFVNTRLSKLVSRITKIPTLIKSSEVDVFSKHKFIFSDFKHDLVFSLLSGIGIGVFATIIFIDWESALVSGIISALLTFCLNQLQSVPLEHTDYHSIIKLQIIESLKFSLLVSLSVFVFLEVLINPIFGWSIASSIGYSVAFGTIGLMSVGIQDVIKHFVLRILLAYNSYLPWKCEKFLNWSVERIFMYNIGGGYVFIHRFLLNYYSEQYISQGRISSENNLHIAGNKHTHREKWGSSMENNALRHMVHNLPQETGHDNVKTNGINLSPDQFVSASTKKTHRTISRRGMLFGAVGILLMLVGFFLNYLSGHNVASNKMSIFLFLALPSIFVFIISRIYKSYLIYALYFSVSLWYAIFFLAYSLTVYSLFSGLLFFAMVELLTNSWKDFKILKKNARLYSTVIQEQLANTRRFLSILSVSLTIFVFFGILGMIKQLPSNPSYIGLSYEYTDAGLIVTDIISGGPADKSGLLKNDIITKLDDFELVNGDRFVLTHCLSDYQPGDNVNLEIIRNEQIMIVNAVVEKAPLVPRIDLHLQSLDEQSFVLSEAIIIPKLPFLFAFAAIAFGIHLMDFASNDRKTVLVICGLLVNSLGMVIWFVLRVVNMLF